ncbi:unnamed protein product [Withania somnifera]
MGRKGNDVSFAMIITIVMVSMFYSLRSISCDCFTDCIRKCPAEDYQCYDRCGWQCPHNVTTSFDYCTSGCSIRHCSKLPKDGKYGNQWQACKDNCATNICNVKTE